MLQGCGGNKSREVDNKSTLDPNSTNIPGNRQNSTENSNPEDHVVGLCPGKL